MKSKVVAALKLLLPLGFGIFLIWLFYDALCEDQRKDLFKAFGKANYWWVAVGVVMGWFSHLSRAYRWKYLLDPMGYKIGFWRSYHAVMIGYLVNMVFPRAGEASRAAVLSKTEKVPFQKGFGSILAERAVDLVMLATIGLITLFLQADKIDLFKTKVDAFKSGSVGCGNTLIFSILGNVVVYGLLVGFIAVTALLIFKPSFREKVWHFIKGLIEGIFSIFKTKHKVPFLGHTFLIWILYLGMFYVNFLAVGEMSHLGADAVFAGFIAGAVGIVLVQGGIGVYPAFVGLITTIYLPGNIDGIAPEALAMGWIAWTSQTIMLIVLGLISLAVNGKNVKFTADEPTQQTQS